MPDEDQGFHEFASGCHGGPDENAIVSTDYGLEGPEASREELPEVQRREVAALETAILEAQRKYEATIRQHLQVIQSGRTADDNAHKFPQLYANVQRWQEQLAPVLQEVDSHPEFSIQQYGAAVVSDMADIQRDGDEFEAIPFKRLVQGHPRWEVCRRFLTCLLLTSKGNTDITFEDGQDGPNNFNVKFSRPREAMLPLGGDDVLPSADRFEASVKRKTSGEIQALADGGGSGEPRRKQRRLRRIASPAMAR
jgi:hypothetical protein